MKKKTKSTCNWATPLVLLDVSVIGRPNLKESLLKDYSRLLTILRAIIQFAHFQVNTEAVETWKGPNCRILQCSASANIFITDRCSSTTKSLYEQIILYILFVDGVPQGTELSPLCFHRYHTPTVSFPNRTATFTSLFFTLEPIDTWAQDKALWLQGVRSSHVSNVNHRGVL